MTLLNVTITDNRVWISADSAIADPVGVPLEGAASANPAELPKDFAEPGHRVSPPAIAVHRRKVSVLPDRKRLIAASGMAILTVFATGIIVAWGDGPLEGEVGLLAAELRQLAEILPAGAAAGLVIVAGYDDATGAAAYMLGSGEGWNTRRLGQGTASVPTPCPALEGYADLHKHYIAPPGTEVEALHLALAQNQAKAARLGLYRVGVAVGGDLLLAEVDAAGARSKVIGHL